MNAFYRTARTLGAAGLIGLFIFQAACVKQPPPDKGLPPAETLPSLENAKNGFQKPVLPPPQTKAPTEGAIQLVPSPAPAPTPGPNRQLSNEIGLFAYFPQQRLMPTDFKIGELQDQTSATREMLGAADLIDRFLNSIMKKKVDDSLVLPAAKAAVRAVISYPLAQGYVPESFRIGKLRFESTDELRAGLRLYKGDGVTAGDVYLKKSGEDWLVSDLQAGFTLLGKKYEKANEPYMPGSYRFLLGDR